VCLVCSRPPWSPPLRCPGLGRRTTSHRPHRRRHSALALGWRTPPAAAQSPRPVPVGPAARGASVGGGELTTAVPLRPARLAACPGWVSCAPVPSPTNASPCSCPGGAQALEHTGRSIGCCSRHPRKLASFAAGRPRRRLPLVLTRWRRPPAPDCVLPPLAPQAGFTTIGRPLGVRESSPKGVRAHTGRPALAGRFSAPRGSRYASSISSATLNRTGAPGRPAPQRRTSCLGLDQLPRWSWGASAPVVAAGWRLGDQRAADLGGPGCPRSGREFWGLRFGWACWSAAGPCSARPARSRFLVSGGTALAGWRGLGRLPSGGERSGVLGTLTRLAGSGCWVPAWPVLGTLIRVGRRAPSRAFLNSHSPADQRSGSRGAGAPAGPAWEGASPAGPGWRACAI